MSELHTFTLLDDDGAPHAYTLAPHGVIEGREITSRLLAVSAPAVGRLAGSALAGKTGGLESILEADVGEILSAIDWSAIGSDVGGLVAVLDGKTIDGILRYATRDGHPLSNSARVEMAFRRNYGELVALVVESVKYNRFFPIAAISRLFPSEDKKAPQKTSPSTTS